MVGGSQLLARFCGSALLRLSDLEKEGPTSKPTSGTSWSGVLVTIGGMGFLGLGVLGAENLLPRVSVLVVLAGLIVQFSSVALFDYFYFLGLFSSW
jgi:hypothetical protein